MKTCLINGREYDFAEGETILEVARRNQIFIPTLCRFAPLKHEPGTCRVCLVKVTDEHGTRMTTSCDTRMLAGMRVDTLSKEVRERQRTQVELLFADHDQNCVACARHGDCELQDLGQAVGLTQNRFAETLHPCAARPLDLSANGIIRDMSKCVRCLRCVEVCRTIQGVHALTIDGKGLETCIGVGLAPNQSTSACVQCGQCILVCPTGALSERDDNDQVLDWLTDPEITTVFSFAPSVRVLLGEEFGFEPGTNVEGRIVAALKSLGADIVTDTDFGADVVIMEEGTELLSRIREQGVLPMFTSCCPGWINYAEKHYPLILPHLSTTRSPQGVQGSLAKTYLPAKMSIDAKRIRTISIMPCTAKKDECARPELAPNGVRDTDRVLTVREFARLLRRTGIDLGKLAPAPLDNPYMSDSTGAAVIFGTTGGVMEAAIRTVYAVLNGKELEGIDVHAIRGLDGLREAEINLGPEYGTIKVAIAHTLRNARKLAEQAVRGESPYTFIEVMACPGGCVNGGGIPRVKGEYHLGGRRRRHGLFCLDQNMPRRQSHNNPQIKRLYEEFLDAPNSEKAHHLLHTHYSDRSGTLTESIACNKARLTLTE